MIKTGHCTNLTWVDMSCCKSRLKYFISDQSKLIMTLMQHWERSFVCSFGNTVLYWSECASQYFQTNDVHFSLWHFYFYSTCVTRTLLYLNFCRNFIYVEPRLKHSCYQQLHVLPVYPLHAVSYIFGPYEVQYNCISQAYYDTFKGLILLEHVVFKRNTVK